METILQRILERYKQSEGNLIALLQLTQEEFGYVPKEAVYWLSRELDIHASRFFGIATFYAQFHLVPRGKNIITACCGTACHVRGSEQLLNAVKRKFGLNDTQETTADGMLTFEKLACLGTCSLAPVFIVKNKMLGKCTQDKLLREITALRKGDVAD